MKKVYLVIPLLIALVCSALMFTSIPTVYAATIPSQDAIAELTKISASQNTDQIDAVTTENTVTYSSPSKSLQYHRGNFDNTTLKLSNETDSFELLVYDWYMVEYYDSYVLAADVTSNISLTSQSLVVAIFLFPIGVTDSQLADFDIDISTTPTIKLVYTDATQSVCHKIIAPVSQAAFEQVLALSTSWELSRANTDQVSQVLIESFSYEDNFKLSMADSSPAHTLTDQQVATMSIAGVEYANAAQTVRCNAYDEYTDTDSYILEYAETYYDRSQTYLMGSQHIPYTDDPIVNIIPRYLFTVIGTYSYIGKEYGFFIKTAIVGSETISSYIVFDIDVVAPYPQRLNTSPPPSVTVTPLFSGTTKYASSIITQKYSTPYLALSNIDISVSVRNVSEKNIDDDGYDPYQDNGYAIGAYTFNAQGTGPKRDSQSIDASVLDVFLGVADIATSLVGMNLKFWSIAETIVGTLNFAMDCYDANQRIISASLTRSGNGFTANGTIIGNSNTNSMIHNYGNLVKGFKCSIADSSYQDTDYPILYKTSAHHFAVEYGFCQKDSDINWDAYVVTSISLDIYQDNTNNVWPNWGSIDLMDSVTGGSIVRYNEYPSNTCEENISEDELYHASFASSPNTPDDAHEDEEYIPTTCSYLDFTFVPNRTYVYCIETFNLSPNADPYLKIYDSQGNRIAYDDDSGGAGRAKITITLSAGQTYKIRTMCYNYGAGAYDFIVRKFDTLVQPSRSSITPTSVVLEGDSVWLTFVPTYDDFYTFTTTGTIDTYLTLYDSNYNRFAADDDSGANYNSLIDMYLKGGTTYYLKVNELDMGSGSCDVYVSRQKKFSFGHESIQACEYTTYFDSPQFFRIEPSSTFSYTFRTSTWDDGDPYLYLYDESWTLITSNDDMDGDTLDAEITYTLQSGKIYYIKIVNNYLSTDFGSLYEP